VRADAEQKVETTNLHQMADGTHVAKKLGARSL